VSIDDELHEQLDGALRAITPRPAPVEGAVRRGKAIRLRRRVAAAASLAAAVAIGVIATPAIRHWQAAPAPATPAKHYTVTVQVPGPHSLAGLIASGTVNGKRWQLTASRPGTEGPDRGQQYITAFGPALGPGMNAGGPSFAPDTDSAAPVLFDGFSGGQAQVQYGAVRADVWYVKVRLGNGTVLTLHPVTVYGVRVVGFAAPAGAVIDATAYSRHGEIATAIPFEQRDGSATFSTWLKPGQHGLARASGRIGSGTFHGSTWWVTAYLGPWGICVETSVSGSCEPVAPAPGTEVSSLLTEDGNLGVGIGIASARVTQIVIHQPDGTAIPVRPVTVGSQKLFAFPLAKGRKALRWTAYDGSGRVVASSRVPPGS
jgi:hypothetical protein